MASSPKGNIRFFVLAFACAFLVLALLGLTALRLLAPRPQDDPSGISSLPVFHLPEAEDNLSLFLVCRDSETDLPVFFALIGMDFPGGQIPVAFFPLSTSVLDDGKNRALSAVYTEKGARTAARVLADTYTLRIDRWADTRSDRLIDAIDRIGSIDYTLPEDLFFESEDLFISFSRGRQLLDGQAFYDLLRCPRREGDPLRQSDESAKLAAAYLNRRLPTLIAADAEPLVRSLFDQVYTDLSYLDYELRLPAMRFLLSLAKDPSFAVSLSGEFGQDETFFPDEPSLRLLSRCFA